MLREKPKRLKLRGESTEAEHWGGPTRMSDEGPVMGLEQRGRVRWLHHRNIFLADSYGYRPNKSASSPWGTPSGQKCNLCLRNVLLPMSPERAKAMRQAIRDLNLRRQTQLSLQDIARQLNPLLRGWIGYYGRYAPSALYPLLRYVNQTLVAWARRKFSAFSATRSRPVGLFNGWLCSAGICSFTGKSI